ncbi:F-box protein-like protein [Tanacetum coccineum]|uniref:F-box protein-like protein n=1 Tax=Tanacetum coccineum TaxID=301880 RepID=A0ABQ5F117_9ASTR
MVNTTTPSLYEKVSNVASIKNLIPVKLDADKLNYSYWSASFINILEGLKLSEFVKPKPIKSSSTTAPPPTTVEDEEEDRISLLSDCLIIEILSRLPLTKDAIKTGVLSKRWQHLWPQNPNLNFTHASTVVDFPFLSGVHKTISSQCRQLNLNKFKLEAYYDYTFESEVTSWIFFAVSRNVQNLDITLMDSSRCHLVSDQSVFINSSFTHLVLKNCILKPTGAISWNKLRSLCITLHKTDKDLIQNILSGSLQLETLEVFLPSGYHYRRIDISSKSVKKLVLEGCLTATGFYGVIEINAPNILSLTIRGSLIPRKYLLQNVSSLVEAELDYEISGFCFGRRKETEEYILLEFILKLCHVNKLTIRNQCLKALFRLEAKGLYFPSCLTFDVTSPYFYDSGSDDSLSEEVERLNEEAVRLYGSGQPSVPPTTRHPHITHSQLRTKVNFVQCLSAGFEYRLIPVMTWNLKVSLEDSLVGSSRFHCLIKDEVS